MINSATNFCQVQNLKSAQKYILEELVIGRESERGGVVNAQVGKLKGIRLAEYNQNMLATSRRTNQN